MIFVTGDTHGCIDIGKLSKSKGFEGKAGDVIIVCGDFGLVWSDPPSKTELYWLDWLESRPFTTCFVYGNHENYDLLATLPLEEKWGSVVSRVRQNVYALKTGHIYNIENQKFFVFGGAESTDKDSRIMGISWWPQEIPTIQEFNLGHDNLEKHQYCVDFILSHTAPKGLIDSLGWTFYNDPTSLMLQSFYETTKFKKWYCGHLHLDQEAGNFRFLYDNIVALADL